MKTSDIVSLQEVRLMLWRGLMRLPVLVIPFGAEREGLSCQVFHSEQEITRDAFEALLKVAHPSRGRKYVHLISKYGEGSWGKQPADPFNYIVT